MESLLAVIAVWLAVNFGLPDSSEHPQIEFRPASAISQLWVARGARSDRSVMGSSDGTAEYGAVHGYYDDETRTIVLTDGWTAMSPADVSILVHEMVHHLQNSGGRSFPCREARERLAYQAQQRWLALFGMSLESEFRIDPLTVLVRTKCIH